MHTINYLKDEVYRNKSIVRISNDLLQYMK
jgi:hypothetical protein